jgi:hypothetical protein
MARKIGRERGFFGVWYNWLPVRTTTRRRGRGRRTWWYDF